MEQMAQAPSNFQSYDATKKTQTPGTEQIPIRSSKIQKSTTMLVSITLVMIIIIVVFGSVIYFKKVFIKNSHSPIPTSHTAVVTMPPEKILPIPNSPNDGASVNTAIYGSGDAASYSAKVIQVILNPPIQGDLPDKGFAYVEVDLSATNHGSQSGPIPGNFYIEDNGIFFDAVSVSKERAGSMGGYFNKHVTVPGKEFLYSTTIHPGQTIDNTYLIFQTYEIKNGDHGHLLWNNGGNDKTNKLYGFYASF